MTFVRITDDWWRVTKGLSAAAKALHVDALSYTAGDLSDCLLAKGDVARCTYLPEATVAEALAELCAGGWWEDRGDAWYIGGNGIGPHQYTRAQVQRYREREREKKARRRAESRSSEGSSLTAYSNPSQAKPSQDTPGVRPPGIPPGDTRAAG